MLSFIKNNIVKVTAINLLIVIGFTFIHSELDQFSFGKDNHDAHDYCDLVNAATLQLTKTSNDKLVKLKLDETICLYCFEQIKNPSNYNNKIDFEQYHTLHKSSELYLFNSTFLI